MPQYYKQIYVVSVAVIVIIIIIKRLHGIWGGREISHTVYIAMSVTEKTPISENVQSCYI